MAERKQTETKAKQAEAEKHAAQTDESGAKAEAAHEQMLKERQAQLERSAEDVEKQQEEIRATIDPGSIDWSNPANASIPHYGVNVANRLRGGVHRTEEPETATDFVGAHEGLDIENLSKARQVKQG